MARCDNCGDKFKPVRFLQKNCLKTDCQIEESTKKALKNLEKIKKDRTKEMRINAHSKSYKMQLQGEINKLARKIDLKFYNSCIDCSKMFSESKIDGGHFNSVGSNNSLRFNLHNIHAQLSSCNRSGLSGGRQLGYFRGLEMRYSKSYAEYVDTGLQNEYKNVFLNEKEIYEKLELVRKINREFDNYEFKNSIEARYLLNKMIGIYK
jgi:hypothetical protein